MKEGTRQESTRQESTRQESTRQESTRQESTRQESTLEDTEDTRQESTLEDTEDTRQDIYDIVVIGGGPSGLALVHYCSNIDVNKKILIIEKEHDIGGCHRVRRVPVKYNNSIQNVFTEHGPRIYSSTYKVFSKLLHDLELQFTDTFTPYNFSISTIGGDTIWKVLSYTELMYLVISFLRLTFDYNYGMDTSMFEFMIHNNFKKDSIDIIDRICRLTDGASAQNYTLHEFLQLFNQQALYTIYQPKYPMDTVLFKKWHRYLTSKNVDFMLNTNVERLIEKDGNIKIVTSGKQILGKTVILAIPPINMVNILENSEGPIKNAFGDLNTLKQWAIKTRYIEYLSMTFHWDTILNLDKVYGFPKTEWGVAFIVLTDYMQFEETVSKTVISLAVTITDKKSSRINKTPNECSKDELIQEVFYQLTLAFPNLLQPTLSLLSPGVIYKNNQWISTDTAFISTSQQPFLDSSSKTINNLYNLGTHNGNHLYKFTSLESAVTNGLSLATKIYPDMQTKYTITSTIQVTDVIRIIIIIIILMYFILFWVNNKKNTFNE
jgi:hypothetical protein